jgi:hypothetical protein
MEYSIGQTSHFLYSILSPFLLHVDSDKRICYEKSLSILQSSTQRDSISRYGKPQLGAPLTGGNVYNPHYGIPIGMVPIQPLMNQFGGRYYPTGQGHGIYQNPRWPAIPQHQSFPRAWAQTLQPQVPFLASLNLPDLSRLMNDLVHHDPSWPPFPTNLPSEIPKFEGKTGKDLGDHVTTFHLWCSFNSLNDDSICLRLFQCTLTGVTTKWYIELPRGDI